jgi:chromosome segregation ATPase
MTDNVDNILPRLLAEIRDANREGFSNMTDALALTNHRLASMDSRLGSMDARLRKMDSTLDRVDSRLEKMDSRLEKMDSRLEKMDSRLEKMDSRLEKMDSRLENVHENTSKTNHLMDRLIGVMNDELADQIVDIRRRLTNIETRLPAR